MSKIKPGKPVPDFRVAATGGRTLSLADFRGHPVVLYFYPKDDTPGCTAEGCAFRDHHAAFRQHGAIVLGVSRDTSASHEKFRARHGFPFDLLADADETLCRLFGVIQEKNMYGRKVMGIERSTFLIDGEGVLRQEWRKVRVEGHVEAVLAAVGAL
ncbi:MAG: peroxiredoxin [Gammaproteobacteria bacterium]|nr:peroxiredoxin [Gammaproteobacteria bacterium]